MFSSETKQKNQNIIHAKTKINEMMNEAFLWHFRMGKKNTNCQLEHMNYSPAHFFFCLFYGTFLPQVWKVRGKIKTFHQILVSNVFSSKNSLKPFKKKCQHFEVSPKITNYRSILREIGWGLQKTFSLGLLIHTSMHCGWAGPGFYLFLNCVTCMSHAWKHSTPNFDLKLPKF